MAAVEITELAPRAYSPAQRGIPSIEAPLHEAAVAAAETLAPPGCEHLMVIPELEVCGMRPDLWVGYFNDEQFCRRAEAGIEACTAPYPLAIAHELRRLGGMSSIERLCTPTRQLGERRRILRGLAELVERGLVQRDGGMVALNAAWIPAEARGVGVEAKVGRWRKAVRQVQMWRPYLNGAWLVFPSSYLASVPRQREAIRSIGIAVVDEESMHIVRRPRLTVGRTYSRLLLEEHLYARWRTEALASAKR
jgi:hypothetical protein